MINYRDTPIQRTILLFVFTLAAVLLFSLTYDRLFSSDDYCTLNFIIEEDGYIVPGFYRPVGDLTLRWTYLFFGREPGYFFVTNAVLQGVNSWLLFLVCYKLYGSTESSKRFLYALFGSIIFLAFHSLGESVLWAIGRGVSLAVTFALLSMVCFLSQLSSATRYVLVCVFYFISLSAYESVLLLPFIMLVAAWKREQRGAFFTWGVLLLSTLLVHIGLRVLITGKLWGGYTGQVFAKDPDEYLVSYIKVLFRLFLPSIDQPVLFSVLALLVVLTAVWFLVRLHRWNFPLHIKTAIAGIAFSTVIAMFYGVSTRTTEGDRLLYFPAVFFAMLIGGILIKIHSAAWRWLFFFVFMTVQIFSVFRTQVNWNKASGLQLRFAREIKQYTQRPLYVVNVPSDNKGAYIFRNCFKEALASKGVDTTRLFEVNKLDYTGTKQPIFIRKAGQQLNILPATTISQQGSSLEISSGAKKFVIGNADARNVVYWNGRHLLPLDGR